MQWARDDVKQDSIEPGLFGMMVLNLIGSLGTKQGVIQFIDPVGAHVSPGFAIPRGKVRKVAKLLVHSGIGLDRPRFATRSWCVAARWRSIRRPAARWSRGGSTGRLLAW